MAAAQTQVALTTLQATVNALTGYIQTLTGEVQALKGLLLVRPLSAGSAPAAAGASPAASEGKKKRRTHEEVEAAKAAKALKPKRAMNAWTAFTQFFAEQMKTNAALMAAYDTWAADPATIATLVAKRDGKIAEAKTEEAKQKLRDTTVRPTKMGYAGHLKDTGDEIWTRFNATFVPPVSPKSSPVLAAAPAPAVAKPTAVAPASPAPATAAPTKATRAKKATPAPPAGYKRVIQDGQSYIVNLQTHDAHMDMNGNCGTRVGEYDVATDYVMLDEEEFVDAE